MNINHPCESASWAANWRKAQKNLLAKTLAEFMYEEIISPDLEQGVYQLSTQSGAKYRYRAEERIFNNYRVDPASMQRVTDAAEAEAFDPVQFLLDIQQDVDIKPFTMSYLVQEMNNTLVADTHMLEKPEMTSDALLDVSGTELEGWMYGHPWIIVSKGRIGFSYSDYQQYAPEMQQAQQLSWIAVDRTISSFSGTDVINENAFVAAELGDDFKRFTDALTAQGLDADHYRLMPIHDWQWNHKLVSLFANEIGQKKLVMLGKAADEYLAMQSIRTMSNTSNPDKHYVKLPMSILNTAVYRGLPGERTAVAPKLTQWAQQTADQDAYITDQCRLILLGEVASINVDNPYYRQIEGAPYQFNELLGVIWRESINSKLDADEKAITMSSLVHVDHNGKPFIQSLIERSGLGVDEWIERMLERTLPPLLHFLYKYGMVFSPHGENSILVMKDCVPERLAMKDFVDDINISDAPLPELESLPEDLKKILLSHPGEVLTHFIYTGLFAVHYRYMTDVLYTYMGYSEGRFWQLVDQTIQRYQAAFPELEERFAMFPMQRPEFEKVCLNRVRVLTLGYADDAERPEPDVLAPLPNPAHPDVYGPWLDKANVA